MTEKIFNEWVREAADRITNTGNYPFIDNADIDMAGALYSEAHDIVKEYPGEVPCSYSAAIEPTIEFFESRLIAARDLYPTRFAILNFLFRLAHFDGFFLKESARELHSEVWPHLERFVRLQMVDGIEDARVIQWEVTNACVVHDWDLASALLDRLKAVAVSAAGEHRALKGQMYLCSVVGPRYAAKLSEKDGSPPLEPTAWWAPMLDRSYGRPAVRPWGLLIWSLTLQDDVAYSVSERERLSDAVHEWEIAFASNPGLFGAYRAAWAKCYFVLGDYARAAEHFDRLISSGSGLPSEIDPRHNLYTSAAECHGRAGNTETAVRVLEECAREFPEARGIWVELARLHASCPLDADFQKVQECLRNEERVDPDFGENPLASIALMLGEVGAPSFQAGLRRIAESNPVDLAFMTSVVSRHWPTFHSLGQECQKEWVGAAIFLWGSATHPVLPAVLRRRTAGAFADIAEGQLRKLFDQLRQDRGPDSQAASPGPARPGDRFAQFLAGKPLTLGEMIFEIDQTCRLPRPEHPELKYWLQHNAPQLIEKWDKSSAQRLNDLRRRCSHGGGEVSELEARELYDLSVWLVDLVARRPSL